MSRNAAQLVTMTPSMVFLSLVACYATGVSILLALAHRWAKRDVDALEKAMAALGDTTTGVEAAKLWLEIARARQSAVPWFERSLSSIGVVAFFSMLVGTGVQTIRASVESANTDRLRYERQLRESELQKAERAVAAAARALMTRAREVGFVEPTARLLLEERLRVLWERDVPGHESAGEVLGVALVLGRLDIAANVVSQFQEVLASAEPADRVSLAEFFVIARDLEKAKQVVARISTDARLSQLPMVRVRLVIVEAALARVISDEQVGEVAHLLRISRSEARTRLEQSVENLRKSTWR